MPSRRGASMIGLLITLVCMLVLGVIAMNAVQKAMTGGGATLPGTRASHADRMQLTAIFQSLYAQSVLDDGRFPVPSRLTPQRDVADDTTANLFSAMIAGQYVHPDQLYSANERNPRVWPDDDYDYTAYDPGAGRFWDPNFVADLEMESNNSFAHVPLYGQRLRRFWHAGAGFRAPLLGNRGPADGVADPSSYTYGADGQWAGHVVFGDGHIEYLSTFTPPSLVFDSTPDNIFRMQDGPGGGDAILAFTKVMTADGPVLQFD